MSRLLSQQERDRFAAWLEQEAESGELMAAQMEKGIQGTPPAHMLAMHTLAKKERAEAMAARIIAKKLRATESFEVEPERP